MFKITAEHKSSANWVNVSQNFWRQLGPKGGCQYQIRKTTAQASLLACTAWLRAAGCVGSVQVELPTGEGLVEAGRQAGACMAPHRECTTRAKAVCGQPGPAVRGSWVRGWRFLAPLVEQNGSKRLKAKSAARLGEFIAGFSTASPSKFVQLGRVVRRRPGVDQYLLTLQGPFLCSLQQVQSCCSKEVSEPSLFLQLDLLTWQRAGN